MEVEAPIYEQFSFPRFQNHLYTSAVDGRSCARGDVRLVQSLRTGLIQNVAFKSSLMEYDQDYDASQDISPVYLDHLEQVVEIIDSTLGFENLMEIGSGKGVLLEILQSRGTLVSGIDPSYVGGNPKIERLRFEEWSPKSKVQGFILRHVLEHVSDPLALLRKLMSSSDSRGRIYIEVPCFDWIMREHAWFSIFYEHCTYFRMSDFQRMFGRIFESGHLFGGQYLYLVADISSFQDPEFHEDFKVSFPSNFPCNFSSLGPSSGARPDVVWGSGSKGIIYSLLRERAFDPVKFIVDANPAKWGRFVPATGLRVTSPKEIIEILEPESEICVMNLNYAQEIQEMTLGRFKLVGAICD